MHGQKSFTIFVLEILLKYQVTNWWLKNLLMWFNKEADFFPEINKSFTFPGMGPKIIISSKLSFAIFWHFDLCTFDSASEKFLKTYAYWIQKALKDNNSFTFSLFSEPFKFVFYTFHFFAKYEPCGSKSIPLYRPQTLHTWSLDCFRGHDPTITQIWGIQKNIWLHLPNLVLTNLQNLMWYTPYVSAMLAEIGSGPRSLQEL